MSRSPGKSRSLLHSHTHSRKRAPSLSARFLLVALFGLAGAPVLPMLISDVASADEPQEAPKKAADVEEPTIEDLVGRLGDSSYVARENASRMLAGRGAAALPALRGALGSEDPEVRRRAEVLIDEIARASVSSPTTSPSQSQLRRRPLGRVLSDDPSIDRLFERLDRLFDEADRASPPSPQRLGRRFKTLEDEFSARAAEIESRLRRQLADMDGFEESFRGRGESLERLFRQFGERAEESLGSGSARVQIWRDGSPVFDSMRLFDFAEVGSVGLAVESVPPVLRAHLPIPAGEGFVIGHVEPNSRAAKAGFREHDVLLKVGKTAATDLKSVRTAFASSAEISVEILRGGVRQTITVPKTSVPTSGR